MANVEHDQLMPNLSNMLNIIIMLKIQIWIKEFENIDVYPSFVELSPYYRSLIYNPIEIRFYVHTLVFFTYSLENIVLNHVSKLIFGCQLNGPTRDQSPS